MPSGGPETMRQNRNRLQKCPAGVAEITPLDSRVTPCGLALDPPGQRGQSGQ